MAKALIATLLLLAGCAYNPASQGQTFCSAARPILIAKQDKLSEPTLRSIIGHNEVGQRICGWKAPQ